ncbi:MAG: LysR family transcriptional regulator [Thermoleophilia bacterium]|nr:LysR family transcriptional regulator [Thermoleophilia bacterium]MCZ4497029.1 LysR family transcriptional regulator [Thermoleophilia bacterium]
MADIHLLRTFLTVYRAGTFTRAARELHLTQPAVSQQIRALEGQVGKPLFRRAARGVTPTAAGRELAQAIGTHVDALEGALEGTGATPASVGETVYLGGPEEFLTMRVLPELAPLLDEGLRLRMFFGVDQPVLNRLHAGEVDLAILTTDQQQRGIETQPLCFEYLELVGTPEWKARLSGLGPGRAGADLLRDVPISAYDEDLPLVRLYWQTIFETAPNLRAAYVANSIRASLQFALTGAGITVLPVHSSARSIERGELVPLLDPIFPPNSPLHLAWRAGTLRRTTLARVHERIATAAKDW